MRMMTVLDGSLKVIYPDRYRYFLVFFEGKFPQKVP
jgi:hypothetical protein